MFIQTSACRTKPLIIQGLRDTSDMPIDRLCDSRSIASSIFQRRGGDLNPRYPVRDTPVFETATDFP